ncbi:glycosyltransferase family 4 protein [Rhizobium sp. AG855]|uniref:glycosyltransferase family 4 protein n=1 Tax=Rhizobium sp. AG855 TaxID=2183898 RepID=UPI000FF797D1|nr:glycosyltransferase family 4 protein [Rhizobium sp. AG855]RKE79227.1 glycosyltransferase involved in cell wall biosynthesis [Rhizobium sp. AG855]
MKVLISAYACETGRGSEGEIAWRLVLELAKRHEISVITRANLRPIHEEAFRRYGRPPNLEFIYFDLPWIFRFYKKGRRFFLLYYYLWQVGSGLLARRLQRATAYDLCHHLTGGMDWMPAGLALAQGPFLWGPVGSEDTHPVLRRRLSATSRLKDRLRVIARYAMRYLDPLVLISGRRADRILSHTPETMPRHLAGKMLPFTQTGIEETPSMVQPKADLSRGGELRLLFAGEFKDWKGALLALQAALRFFENDPSARLTMVGDGPLRSEIARMVAAHPQGDRVVITGRLDMAGLVQALNRSDVFLYPSFHHGLSTVVLQAMLTGLPVVCLEGDATGRTVKQEAGITVALRHDRDPVADLAAAIRRLALDETYRQSLARSAQTIARKRHAYAALASFMDQIYQDTGSRS